MEITVNALIQWQNTSEPYVERVLWITPDGQEVVCFDIFAPTITLVFRSYEALRLAVNVKTAVLLEEDPYRSFQRKVVSAKDHQQYERDIRLRDEAWSRIACIIDNPLIYSTYFRGQLIHEQARVCGSSAWKIRRDLQHYWQGGQTREALLPRYHHSGAPGKSRSATNKKRGRPSKVAKATGHPTGVNITQNISECFSRGIELFYLKRQPKPSLPLAYDLTIQRFFNKGWKLLNGEKRAVLPPAIELPTFRQFKYEYYKHRDLLKATIAREGEQRFNLHLRGINRNSTLDVDGPGHVYQIDSTIGDVFLVNSLDRRQLIGRPVIYIIIDVFSRLIVGMHVTLKSPNWNETILALENMVMDKVAFCQEYDIKIDAADWPAMHLPRSMIADRSEMFSKDSDALINKLNVKVGTLPPRRPDWKSIVERSFRLINEASEWIPGSTHHREPGERQCELDACMTLNEFRAFLIDLIIEHNTIHYLEDYPLDADMKADHVRPYPNILWEWGIRNNRGGMRTRDLDGVRLALLPQVKASITPKGLEYSNQIYTSSTIEALKATVRSKGRISVEVSRHPRIADYLYLVLDQGRQLELTHRVVQNAGRDTLPAWCDWLDIADYDALMACHRSNEASPTQEQRLGHHDRRRHMVKEATQKTKAARGEQSDADFRRDQRMYRQEEIKRETTPSQGSPPIDSHPASLPQIEHPSYEELRRWRKEAEGENLS